MSKFLTFVELDTKIQRQMANQAPDEDIRIEAINDALNDLYAQFDIETGRRELAITTKPDGTAIAIEDEVDDFKKVATLRYEDVEKTGIQFSYRNDDEFMMNIGRGARINEYTVYYNDGKLYLKINTELDEATDDVDFTLVYYTFYKALTVNNVFQDDMTNIATDQLLIPRRYKKLIVLKALQYLAPISLGDDAEVQVRKWIGEEQREIRNLGLDIASKQREPIRKVKIRV